MNLAQNVYLDDFKVTYSFLSNDSLKLFHLGQFLSNYCPTEWYLVLVKCLCLGKFLSNYCFYSQWYLVHAYILAWPLECSHPYLTLTFISQSISHATLSYLLIYSFWTLIRMFALISSRSDSQSAMLLRWALQGHHGPLVIIIINCQRTNKENDIFYLIFWTKWSFLMIWSFIYIKRVFLLVLFSLIIRDRQGK